MIQFCATCEVISDKANQDYFFELDNVYKILSTVPGLSLSAVNVCYYYYYFLPHSENYNISEPYQLT